MDLNSDGFLTVDEYYSWRKAEYGESDSASAMFARGDRGRGMPGGLGAGQPGMLGANNGFARGDFGRGNFGRGEGGPNGPARRAKRGNDE